MNNRILRLLVSAGLILALTAGSSSTVIAEGHAEPTDLYFPWVPNGTMLGESGPYFGTVTIQNLEDELIGVYATPTALLSAEEPPLLTSWGVDPFGSITLNLQELGLGSVVAGSAVQVEAVRSSDGQPAKISGVMKQTAPEPPMAGAITGPGHRTSGGYTALAGHEIGESIVLPIVQSNSGWNTFIRVTNFSDTGGHAPVSLNFFAAESGQNMGGSTHLIGPGETATIDLTQTQLGTEWVGSVVITADVPIGAVAERVKDETDMLIINVSRPADSDSASNVAPLILREWNHWNTGISIANLVELPNPVTVSYYATDGTLLDSDHVLVPPNGMNFIYTPSLGDSDGGFVGSALIRAEHPFHGAVDQVKYFGDDEDTGHAMSYMVETSPAVAGEYLTLSLMQKGDPDSGLGDTSGIQVFNPSTEHASATVWFFDQAGQLGMPEPVTLSLGPRQGETVYSMFYPDLPAGFQGSALIRVSSGSMIAASNNVNYEVEFDGSASFNLGKAHGLFGPHAISIEADPNPVPHFRVDTRVTGTITDRFGNLWVPEMITDDFGTRPDRITTGIIAGQEFGAIYTTDTARLDEQGRPYFEMRAEEQSLANRPGEVLVKMGIEDTDISDELVVVWHAPPELTPPDFQAN